MQASVCLNYEPASEPLHIYVKQLFSILNAKRGQAAQTRETALEKEAAARKAEVPTHPILLVRFAHVLSIALESCLQARGMTLLISRVAL